MGEFMTDAKIRENGIYFNGWIKWVGGFLITGIFALNAYAYTVIFPVITENIIINDKDSRLRDTVIKDAVTNNRIAIAELRSMNTKLDSIASDINEFKRLLRRSSPYELRKNE